MAKDKAEFVQELLRMRQASTPLAVITTQDGEACAEVFLREVAKKEKRGEPPVILWDMVRGAKGMNLLGNKALLEMLLAMGIEIPMAQDYDSPKKKQEVAREQAKILRDNTTNALEFISDFSMALPQRAVTLFMNGHWLFQRQEIVQAIRNLREPNKLAGRTLFLLGPAFDIPPELSSDMMSYTEPLPDELGYLEIIQGIAKSAQEQKPGYKAPTEAQRLKMAQCLKGLTPFLADQVMAESVGKDAIDVESVGRRQREALSRIPGISIDKPGLRRADVGGMPRLMEYVDGLFKGNCPPRIVVRIDEIEKSMAGASGPVGDSSGVSQDILSVLLRIQEDFKFPGKILVGPPGTGKTLFTCVLSTEYDIITVNLDLGATKGSFVGESERKIRQAMAAITNIAGEGQALFLATCNNLSIIPPELKRRYKLGVWFFDLPNEDERKAIWKIQRKSFGIPATDPEPDDVDLTGSDIRDICEIAWRMSNSKTGTVFPLREARQFMVPVYQQSRDAIDNLRKAAHNRWNSVTYRGAYQIPGASWGTEEKEQKPTSGRVFG